MAAIKDGRQYIVAGVRISAPTGPISILFDFLETSDEAL